MLFTYFFGISASIFFVKTKVIWAFVPTCKGKYLKLVAVKSKSFFSGLVEIFWTTPLNDASIILEKCFTTLHYFEESDNSRLRKSECDEQIRTCDNRIQVLRCLPPDQLSVVVKFVLLILRLVAFILMLA